MPDDVARQVTDAATTAFHQGFATAVGQTLAVTAVVLVLGFVAAIAMAPKHVEH